MKKLFFFFFLILTFFLLVKAQNSGEEYLFPVKNQNFTENASGWVYGEENDVNNFANGSWSSTGGRGDPGSYLFQVSDDLDGVIAIVNQTISYPFNLTNANILSATVYASFHLTCDSDHLVYACINITYPNGTGVEVWRSQIFSGTGALDTGWINASVDTTSTFSSATGEYQLVLGVHTETSDNGRVSDRTTCFHYLDDAGVRLVYPAEAPKWFSQAQSTSQPGLGAEVNLSAYWRDNVALDFAWLETNETGSWENRSYLKLSGNSAWSNFTWQNSSVSPWTVVGWRIWANDTSGNVNSTNIMTLTVKKVYLSVNLTVPQNIQVVKYDVFFVNATASCISEGDGGNCSTVNGTLRYNSTSSTEPETSVGLPPSTPFYTDQNPKSCGVMIAGDTCVLSFSVNATSDPAIYLLDINFISSSAFISENDTQNILVKVLEPDLVVNEIYFNVSQPYENEPVLISANISNRGSAARNVRVWFNSTDSNGVKTFLGEVFVNISSRSWKLVNLTSSFKIGTHNVSVVADALDEISEENETNNFNSTELFIPSWSYFYGNVSSKITLTDASGNNFTFWAPEKVTGNLFVTDFDSQIDFSSLRPLNGTDDLSELDKALGSENFTDSVKKIYDTNDDGVPDSFSSFTVFGRKITNVPVVSSYEGSPWLTGIMWDGSDGGSEYNGTQDVVFITELKDNLQGAFGFNNYEIRIPALLRDLKSGESKVAIYVEVT